MKKIILLFLAAITSCSASVTINFNIDSLRDSNGNDVSVNSLGLILADTLDNGFGVLNAGSITLGSSFNSDDMVIGRFDFSAFATAGLATYSLTGNFTSNWNAGDKLAIVWMPALTLSSNAIAAGDRYGLISDSTWITPADGFDNVNAYQLFSATRIGVFATNPATKQITDLESRASLTAIPEPSSFAAFAGLAMLGTAALRRRKRAA